MTVFLEVVDRGGFTAAAARLGLTAAGVSKSVAQLEQHLGARLLNRTTRRVSLTDAGRAFAERCRAILRDVEEAELAAGQIAAAPRGHLCVSAPSSFGARYLGAAFAEFLRRYPQVTLEVSLSDRFVDVVREGFDVAIRIAELVDSSLVARFLAPCRRVYCAAPAYLDARGRPRTPADLRGHHCLRNSNSPQPNFWQFHAPDGGAAHARAGGRGSAEAPDTVAVDGPLATDSGHVLYAATLAGRGIALLPTFFAGPDLRAGRLEVVLPEYRHPDLGIHALYPSRRYLSAKTRALVEFLAERFGGTPEWDRVPDAAAEATRSG